MGEQDVVIFPGFILKMGEWCPYLYKHTSIQSDEEPVTSINCAYLNVHELLYLAAVFSKSGFLYHLSVYFQFFSLIF